MAALCNPHEFKQKDCCNSCRTSNCGRNKRWPERQLNIECKVYYPPHNKPKHGIYDNLPQHEEHYNCYYNERNRRNKNPVIARKAFCGFGSAACRSAGNISGNQCKV